ncbi:Uracil phosphoribosyltransferase, synthesizes UMP from uracil, variant 2 [Chamberlinius hualienensis]
MCISYPFYWYPKLAISKITTDHYHFQHRKVAKRSVVPNNHSHNKLSSDASVKWAKQQVAKVRVKRDYREAPSGKHFKEDLNDPQWPQMWYLNRGNGLDMNVQAAWAQGVTGKGVVITILDDGLEKDHPDINLNYDPLASYDVNNHDDDPQPRYDFVDSNRHGTRCAGEVAANANNSICAVGIAYESHVGGVRMLDGDVTDAVEARSLSLNPQHIHIYSASWGPDDDGKTVDGPGELATKAFQEGIRQGRDGLGSIFIWASGNGGRDHDNCNCDGYTNSIWTLSISSATENGLVPWYSEACSSTLATTYSSGSVGEKQVVTTDLHHGCTSTHTGTSASAPLAAGICALALQVNPKITWRDMQHIVVRTAKPANLKTGDWQTNGVGRNVSHSFGYGLMDAAAMVDLARNWTTVPSQMTCEQKAPYTNKLIPAKSKVMLTLVVNCHDVRYLEHVQAKITLTASRRGDIKLYLKSPSGTRSNLLDIRPNDMSSSGFRSWPFMTVHNWGENPNGLWVLEIHNEGRYEASITNWDLTMYGTREEPQSRSNMVVVHNNLDGARAGQQNAQTDLAKDMSSSASPPRLQCLIVSPRGTCLECPPRMYAVNGMCLNSCPEGHFESSQQLDVTHLVPVCLKCHYTCRTCSGPNDYQCIACYGDAELQDYYCRPMDLLHRLNTTRHYEVALFIFFLVCIMVFFGSIIYVKMNRGQKYTALSQSSEAIYNQDLKKEKAMENGTNYTYDGRESDESQE